MVLGADDDPLHARFPGDADDFIGIEFGWVELLGKSHVFVVGDLHLVFDPLADAVEGLALPLATEVGVEAHVDEHAVVAIAEQGGARAALDAVLDGFVAPHFVHRFVCGNAKRKGCERKG
jgi:hypothetical protein